MFQLQFFPVRVKMCYCSHIVYFGWYGLGMVGLHDPMTRIMHGDLSRSGGWSWPAWEYHTRVEKIGHNRCILWAPEMSFVLWDPMRFMHLEGLYNLFVSKLVNIHVIFFILKDFALSFEVCSCESLSLLGSGVWELSSFLENYFALMWTISLCFWD